MTTILSAAQVIIGILALWISWRTYKNTSTIKDSMNRVKQENASKSSFIHSKGKSVSELKFVIQQIQNDNSVNNILINKVLTVVYRLVQMRCFWTDEQHDRILEFKAQLSKDENHSTKEITGICNELISMIEHKEYDL